MITLYTFGPNFGLPDPSPFCMKALTLLKMSGLEFQTRPCDPRKAPKGKGPWMDDNGTPVPDTTFIRWHLESKHGIDFDKGLGDVEKATGWAFEKMCEDHLYWVVLYERWMLDEHFNNGPRVFFETMPALVRPVITGMVRRQLKRDLWGHGMSRHSYPDIQRLAIRDIEAIATFLDDKPYIMGNNPCGADATIHAFVAMVLCEHFKTPVLAAAQKHANLVAYLERGLAAWYPDFKAVA